MRMHAFISVDGFIGTQLDFHGLSFYVLNLSGWEIENTIQNTHLMALWTSAGSPCILYGKLPHIVHAFAQRHKGGGQSGLRPYIIILKSYRIHTLRVKVSVRICFVGLSILYYLHQ